MTSVSAPGTRQHQEWGRSRARYLAGLTLIALGIAATNLTSTYTLWLLAIGPGVQAVGWLLLPGAVWRRVVVLLPCLVAGLALLAGPSFAGSFAVLLAGWLLVRRRPALSYLVLVLPIVASFLFQAALHEYGQNWVILAVGAVITVGGAWLARWIAHRRTAFQQMPSQTDRSLR